MATSDESSAPLTAKDKQFIVESWTLVKQDLGQNGILLFITFFEDYPQNKSYFKLKSTESREEMKKDPVLKSHALRVMREIDSIVDNIDNTEVLLGALKQNALNHRKRSISKTTYDELRLTLLKVLSTQLGDLLSTEAKASWNKALTFLFKVITDINDEKNIANE